MRKSLVMVIAAAATLLGGPALAAPHIYEPPAPLPAGQNGDIIRSEPTDFFLNREKRTRPPAHAWRIMYRSTDTHGKPVVVTGTVLAPLAPWAGPGQRPLVGYTVGTQGVADSCAPSLGFAAGWQGEAGLIAGLIAHGFGVVITDYQGLGTPGTHTYYNRLAQGHAVLDALRAAQRLPAARLPGRGPVATFGYSQGGGASAAAAELAASYAPDLDLKGSYAGAVRGDQRGMPGPQVGYLVLGLDAAYPDLHVKELFNAKGKRVLDELSTTCVGSARGELRMGNTSSLTVSGKPLWTLLAAAPYAAVVTAQRLGGIAPAAPVLLAHSRNDEVMPWERSRDTARGWCAGGAKVQFYSTQAPTHIVGGTGAYPSAVAWLEGRFAGRPAPVNCGTF